MENTQVQLKQILPNPFKKEIDNGKLNEEQVQKLMEGYKQTTFHENILARRSKEHNDKYELVYGHHRLEAARRTYGNNHEINLNIVNYTDDQMMIDLCRENLTQGKHGSFNSELDSVLLVKKYLETKVSTSRTPSKHSRKQDISQGIGARQVAEFLSKEGKLIKKSKVAELLHSYATLAPDVLERVKGSSEANELSRIKDHAQQRQILDIVNVDEKNKREVIRTLVATPEADRKKILDGDLSILGERKDNTKDEPMPNGVIGLRFMKRSLELINEMRFLRNTLQQFRKDKLFEHFTSKQRGSFSEKLTTIKKEYGELVDELEKSLEELK